MRDLAFNFLSGVALAFLFVGWTLGFLLLSILLALFRLPFVLLLFSLLYELAFWDANLYTFPFVSITILFVYLLSAFVRRNFLW